MKSKLANVNEILDEWTSCQQKWMYLEPIFSQFEVQRQLVNQTAKFKAVDRKWRGIMRSTQKYSNILAATTQTNLANILREFNHEMELILYSLDGYLQSKRSAFPRFFFLSDEEIFQLMSQVTILMFISISHNSKRHMNHPASNQFFPNVLTT
jgi:dynein heavy chain